MKDVKYYKEGAHNYMILTCSGKGEKSYQQKMLERQNLPHIFGCKIKYINGEAFYYYDITSKVNIQNLHRGKEWNFSMIKKVLSDYETALGELDSFLLEQDKVVLDPEYIYYDYGTDRYIFLFYPDHQGQDNAYEALFDFWVEHLDNQDSAAVECIYKMYEEAENCCLGIGRMRDLLEKYDPSAALQDGGGRGDVMEVAGNGTMQGKEQYMSSMDRSAYDMSPETVGEQTENQRQNSPGSVFYIAFLALAVLGEFGVGAVYLLFKCSEKEKMILLAAAVVMACLVVCACRLLIRERGFQKRKEQYDQALTEYRENDYIAAVQPTPEKVQMKEFLSVGKEKAHDAKGVYSGSTFDLKAPLRAGDGHNDGTMSEDDLAGETVFFSSDAVFENKLYALDRKNKQHISLDKLPVTVGKLKGVVDIYLNDTSVSRMHAQIETDGKAYFIKDLNSTNGTFLNGLRLEPNARMEMEPGDEIRFGKLKYSFR